MPSWESLRIRPSSLLCLPPPPSGTRPSSRGAPFSCQKHYSELRRVRRHTDPRGAGGRRSSTPQRASLKKKWWRCLRGRTSTEVFLIVFPRAPDCPSARPARGADHSSRCTPQVSTCSCCLTHTLRSGEAFWPQLHPGWASWSWTSGWKGSRCVTTVMLNR